SPRTATVAYEVGITPFLNEGQQQIGLVIFTCLFFAVTLLLSLNPVKLVNHVGKLLAPGIVILLSVLLFMVITNPPGMIQSPAKAYMDNPFITGFLDGYNTMDAFASLVFGIIVINAVRSMGITSKQ